MSKVSVSICLDTDLKKAGGELFAGLGLDMDTAVTLFMEECLRAQGIPFPSPETSQTRRPCQP